MLSCAFDFPAVTAPDVPNRLLRVLLDVGDGARCARLVLDDELAGPGRGLPCLPLAVILPLPWFRGIRLRYRRRRARLRVR